MATPGDTTRQAAVGATQGLNVDKATARKMVLVGTFALVAINLYRARAGATGEPDFYRRMWGTGVVGIMLATLADFAPQVAGPFSVLIVLGSLTKHGDEVFSNALGKASSKPTPRQPGREAPGVSR